MVCAMYTGVNLSTSDSCNLLFNGIIMEILVEKSIMNPKPKAKKQKRKELAGRRRYWPRLVTSYGTGETKDGEKKTTSVEFSDKDGHAEMKVVSQLEGLTRVVIFVSSSSCTDCIGLLEKEYGNLPRKSRPIICIFWVHDYPGTSPENLKQSIDVLQKLARTFDLHLWNCTRLLEYLIEVAPTDQLRKELRAAAALSKEAFKT